MSDNRFIAEVQEDENGAFIVFPEEMMNELGWKEGDTIDWKDNGDGSYTLSKVEKDKKEMEWVLVETVQTFRHRYVVQVPKGKSEWALDTVAMEEAVEFSQQYLGETIVSDRVVSYEEALRICNEDNDYIEGWSDEQKVKVFFTPYGESK